MTGDMRHHTFYAICSYMWKKENISKQAISAIGWCVEMNIKWNYNRTNAKGNKKKKKSRMRRKENENELRIENPIEIKIDKNCFQQMCEFILAT